MSGAVGELMAGRGEHVTMPKIDPEEMERKTDEVLKFIGLRLRSARVAAGLTQKDLGEMTGRTQSYLYEIETGRTNTSIRILLELTTALDIELQDLLPASRSAVLTVAGVDELIAVWGRVAELLSDRQQQQQQDSALMAELLRQLHEFAELRGAVEGVRTGRPRASGNGGSSSG
jgi:transcriptional regulator with XRE-family HTH domain